VRRKQSSASSGRHTTGSFSFKDVLSGLLVGRRIGLKALKENSHSRMKLALGGPRQSYRKTLDKPHQIQTNYR
jgi:hypothetical protein